MLLQLAVYVLLLVVLDQVTDAMLMNASFIYPENTPTTKEAYYYRTIFEKFFPKVGLMFQNSLSLSLLERKSREGVLKAQFLFH